MVKKFRVFHDRDASKLPWSEEGVEIVMECTGKYRDAEEAKVHLNQPTVKKCINHLHLVKKRKLNYGYGR